MYNRLCIMDYNVSIIICLILGSLPKYICRRCQKRETHVFHAWPGLFETGCLNKMEITGMYWNSPIV